MDIDEFDKKDILGDFEYELNKLCRNCIGTATEIKIKQQPLILLFEKSIWAYEKEKEKNKELEELNFKYTVEIASLKTDVQEIEKENKKLNILRLDLLISQFPDTTETYKKYKKELDELLKEE